MKRTILTIALLLAIGVSAIAQKVERNGNVFKAVRVSVKDSTKTQFFYADSKGNQYPIYLSQKGKAFVGRISKNGKYYRMYLPEVTKQLATKKES